MRCLAQSALRIYTRACDCDVPETEIGWQERETSVAVMQRMSESQSSR